MPDTSTAPTATDDQSIASGTKMLGFYLNADGSKTDALIPATAFLPASSPLLPNYATIADGVAAVAVGKYFTSGESGVLREYQRTSTSPFYVEVGQMVVLKDVQASQHMRMENLAALRAFANKLDVFSQSEEGVLPVSCYGDSVGADGAITFIDQIAREYIGFVGTSSWSDQRLNNAWDTPTGTEPSGRWPGAGQPSYVLAGGASFIERADGSTPDPVYNPARDRHWLIPNGGSVTWTIGLAGTNFRRIMAFLVKESGAGSATVELLNAATDTVISTNAIGSLANGSITATHADFNTLDTALGYKVRVTCTAGSIRALGVVGMQRRCVLPLFWNWGGSYLQQQNRSSDAIFQYVNNTLGTAITFVETRGETPTEFSGAGIGGDATSGITNMCARLASIPGSKVLIGGRPTPTASNDSAQTELYRAAAKANDFAFIDGVALLKDNAALAALLWNQKNGVVDNVHLPLITAGYITGFLLASLPLGHIRNLWNCRDVRNSKTISVTYKVTYSGQVGEVTNAVTFAQSAAANTYKCADLLNIANINLVNASSGAAGKIYMFGSAIRFDNNLDLASGFDFRINGTPLIRGQISSGWGVPTGTFARGTFVTYAAPVISATYTQAEVQAIADHVQVLSQRLAALMRDLNNATGTNVRLLA